MPEIGKQALAGTKLAEPVMGQSGIVLPSEGTELNEKFCE